jgi:hypothetical protein
MGCLLIQQFFSYISKKYAFDSSGEEFMGRRVWTGRPVAMASEIIMWLSSVQKWRSAVPRISG